MSDDVKRAIVGLLMLCGLFGWLFGVHACYSAQEREILSCGDAMRLCSRTNGRYCDRVDEVCGSKR